MSKNIRSEVKKLENQMIETTTRLLTSHQIFLKEAKGNATNQINKTESLEAIKEAREQAKNEISGAKKPIIIKTLIFLRLNKAC
ncbi:hypothetical protein VN0773_12710 [Helicobacter pylori]|nr:hypothetical protein VN1277_11270 [Helicobacter pylori]